MTRRRTSPNPELASQLVIYKGQTHVRQAATSVVVKADVEAQVLNLCRLMARALPDPVVRRFCEELGADYDRLVWIGSAGLTSVDRHGIIEKEAVCNANSRSPISVPSSVP